MINLIVEYKQKFNPVFIAVKNNNNYKNRLTARDIFPNEEDPNIKLMEIYFWLMM